MLKVQIISLVALLLLFESAQAHEDQEQPPQFTFEDEVSSSIVASAGSVLTISDRHSKDGNQSLRWIYQPGDVLEVNQTIEPIVPRSDEHGPHVPVFVVWIYSEKSTSTPLTVSFQQGDASVCGFKATLNFVGWRSLLAAYLDDLKCPAHSPIDRITLAVGKSGSPGELYLDTMLPLVILDPRSPTPDRHLPFVNLETASSPNAHWTGLLLYDTWLRRNVEDIDTSAEAIDGDVLAKIEARVDDALLSSLSRTETADFETLKKQYRSFQLETDDGARRIRPVILPGHRAYYPAALDGPEPLLFRAVGEFLWRLAVRYRLTEDEKQKRELAKMFNWIAGQLHDQGFAAGSATGIIHHMGYSMREWARALYLMRDRLGSSREQRRDDLAWFMGLGRMFRPRDELKGFNVDVMNTLLQGMLFSALMTEDKKERAVLLRQLSEWMSASLLATRGLGGGIQPDGSFFHHSQHYVAYGNGGLDGLTPVVYFLSSTPLALSDAALAHLRNAVLMTRVFSNDQKVPMSLSGRHPNGRANISVKPFLYLSKLTDAYGNPDGEMIRAYLRLIRHDPNGQYARGLAENGFNAERPPQGAWVLPYSSLVLQRRDEWLASARGFSRYLVGNESYVAANLFGRFINYGQVEILPEQAENRGFREDGWNWSRWPGTTAPQLPLGELRADIRQVDRFSGREEMLLSDQTFSGGNVLQAANAMFAVILHGHSKYDDSFWARKSVFFFDDRIVALGSGICSDDNRYSVGTTLYQHALLTPNQETIVNGEKHVGLKTNLEITTTAGEFLLDPAGNAYIPAPAQTLLLQRQSQESRDNKDERTTQGDFATAIIDHGPAPDDATYEYAILIQSTSDEARRFALSLKDAKRAPYSVLRHDRDAHVVWDRETDITAYALFEAGAVEADEFLESVDTPVLVMTRNVPGGKIMSIVNPDLNLYTHPEADQIGPDGEQLEVSIYSRKWRYSNPRPSKVNVELIGKWSVTVESEDIAVAGYGEDLTQLEVTTVASTPVELLLQPVR